MPPPYLAEMPAARTTSVGSWPSGGNRAGVDDRPEVKGQALEGSLVSVRILSRAPRSSTRREPADAPNRFSRCTRCNHSGLGRIYTNVDGQVESTRDEPMNGSTTAVNDGFRLGVRGRVNERRRKPRVRTVRVYSLCNDDGQPLGTISNTCGKPLLGLNAPTVLLRR